jgi:lysozyme
VSGIDISDAQGTINWTSVRGAGIRFAVMKATQGTYNTQHTFAANWSGARAAGLLRAAYHFFDPTEDGTAQANHFLATMGTLEADDLPPVIDIECPNSDSRCLGWAGGTGAAPAASIRQRMMDFLHRVESVTGRRPVIYTSGAYFSGNGIDTTGLANYPLWIAYPTTSGCYRIPTPWAHAAFWQYSWTGRVAGIPGADVDMDHFLGTLDDLNALASGGSTPPSPPPPPSGPSCAGLNDGLYCGSDHVMGSANTLYRCSGGSISVEQTCTAGCQVNPAGVDDACSAPPPPPPSGPSCAGLHDGLYCGSDHVMGSANTLYRCAGGSISVAQTCSAGCQVNPAGVDDACRASTPPPPPTDPCASQHDCASCTAQAACGWCNGACVTGTGTGPSSGSCGSDSWHWTSDQCSAPAPADPCAAYTDCASCTAQPSCGFCDGACHTGTSTGPNSGSCSSTWAWYSSQCG